MPTDMPDIQTRGALRQRIFSALGRWLDSYIVWHSRDLALAKLASMSRDCKKGQCQPCC